MVKFVGNTSLAGTIDYLLDRDIEAHMSSID